MDPQQRNQYQRCSGQAENQMFCMSLSAQATSATDIGDLLLPVSVVCKFHLIRLQLRQQQHQDFNEYEENDLQHTSNVAVSASKAGTS